jgi:ABC-type antimicrobial peptide transport system permease subunit
VTWRDAIVVAGRSVKRRSGRAVLTVLAVALAATLLTSLLIASGAARRRVLDHVSEGGPLAGIEVAAAAPDPGALDSDEPSPGAAKSIDDAALARIERLPGVKSVVPVIVNPVSVIPPRPPVRSGRVSSAGNTDRDLLPIRESLVGADFGRARDLPITLLTGRLPRAGSLTEVAVTLGYVRRFGLRRAEAHRVVGTELVLGSPRLFPDTRGRPRGRWTRAEIVGVVAQQAASGQIVAPIEQARIARTWSLGGIDPTAFGVDNSPYSALFVVASGLSQVTDVREAINRIGYSTSAPETLIEQVQRYLHVVEIVLGGIGLIGLAIAALGITNAMLAAVRERRREIGVLKAIGARDRDVRRVFLLEAGTLGFAGGTIGSVVGYLIARALASVVNRYLTQEQLPGVSFGVPVFVLVLAIVGATLLALVAGTLPAQRAARLPARQAMGDR